MTHAVLTVLNWCRRNPGKTALIIVLLIVLPKLDEILIWLGERLLKTIGGFAGRNIQRSVDAVAKVTSKVITWFQQQHSPWIVAAALLVVSPIVGFFFSIKVLIDTFKPSPQLTIVSAPGSDQ